MIQNDTKISMYDIMIRLDISKGSIFELIDSLRYRKTCSKWVHKLLTRDMMYSRKEICTDLLNIFCGSLTNEFRGVITCDDTCIYHCDPFSKSQSVERAHKGSPPKMKPKISKSQGKVMITVFWDQERIIFIDDLKRHATINKEKYCLSLEKLKRAIKTKWPGLQDSEIRFHQDSTIHMSFNKIASYGLTLMRHPAYSSDLAPFDFY